MGLGGKYRLHTLGIGGFIALAAGGPYRRAAAKVEGLGLERGKIGVAAHFAAQGVELADQVALGEAANRRVARHPRQGVEAGGNQGRFNTHPGGGKRCLAAGMTAADHDDAKIMGSFHRCVV